MFHPLAGNPLLPITIGEDALSFNEKFQKAFHAITINGRTSSAWRTCFKEKTYPYNLINYPGIINELAKAYEYNRKKSDDSKIANNIARAIGAYFQTTNRMDVARKWYLASGDNDAATYLTIRNHLADAPTSTNNSAFFFGNNGVHNPYAAVMVTNDRELSVSSNMMSGNR